MFNRKKNFREKAEDLSTEAVDRVGNFAEEIGDRIKPFIDERVRPLLDSAFDNVRPVAHDVKVNTASTMHGLVENAKPGVDDAMRNATKATESAREKFVEDFLPRLEDALRSAAELPAVHKADGVIDKIAEDGGLKKKENKGIKRLGMVAGATGLLAGLVLALRKFLGDPQANGWTAHEPSTAYVPADSDAETIDAEVAEGVLDDEAEPRRGFTDPESGVGFTTDEQESPEQDADVDQH